MKERKILGLLEWISPADFTWHAVERDRPNWERYGLWFIAEGRNQSRDSAAGPLTSTTGFSPVIVMVKVAKAV